MVASRAMKAGSKILVSCVDRIVWIRVEGNGSSSDSTALKEFAREMIHRGAREFIVDLCNCAAMDSTFMGTLAGISYIAPRVAHYRGAGVSRASES